jgi:hypothetical protein
MQESGSEIVKALRRNFLWETIESNEVISVAAVANLPIVWGVLQHQSDR